LAHSRPFAAHRSRPARAHAIDLGNELPLSVDGNPSPMLDRHRVSVQWLAATVLAAFCGAALMSGAVLAALDHDSLSIARPEESTHLLRGVLGASAVDEAGKGDRLPIAKRPTFVHQTVPISIVSRVGNREVVRARSFVRVGGKLSLAASGLLAHIPPYNPQRLLAASAPGGHTTPQAAAQSSTAVSFVTRDLAKMHRIKTRFVTPLAEVMARVREAAVWSRKTSDDTADNAAAADDITGIKLAYADEDTRDPFAGLHARIVPENVSLKSKTADKITDGTSFKKRVVVAKKGDTISGILHGLGATAGRIAAIVPALGSFGGNKGLTAGDKVQVLLAPKPGDKSGNKSDNKVGGKSEVPLRVIVADAHGPEAVAALADSGKYVSVDPSDVDDAWAAAPDRTAARKVKSGISLYQSVYETALGNHIPVPIIKDLIRIFAFDVDFDRTAQPNDSLHMLYASAPDGSTPDSANDILFASLTVDGRTKKLYRFRSGPKGTFDYYNGKGRSARKFLLRKPLATGHLTSGFGWRRHPILGYVAMHTGIDWGAPYGTPIYAAGNGVIERERWESGYGRYILLRHKDGYETAYGHMSAFAKGTHVGEHVKQGQVIGFVGSTGLATGAHLHFEIHLNDHFVDPLRVKLPDGHKLRGPALADFERERARIDKIMARKPLRIATRDVETGN
jgi:murein DD-endopeptidase MepM/ murein hydrolase activator NlpD